MSLPILALSHNGLKYTLDTDACGYQVGCAFLQEQPRRRYSTDRILEPRVDRCGAQLYDYRKRMLGRSVEHSHATAEPIRKRFQPPHGSRGPTLGPQFGGQFRSARSLAPALGGVRLRGTVPPRHRAPTRWLVALTYRWGDTETVDDEVLCFAVQYDKGSEALLKKVHWDLPQDRPDCFHALVITPVERDAASISVEEFLIEQTEDSFCRFAAETTGMPNSKFNIDRYGFLVRNSPLDGTLQRVVPTQLRPRVLYLAHHPRLGGHPGATSMYYTLRGEYTGHTWPATRLRPYGIALRALRPAGRFSRTRKISSYFPRRAPWSSSR